MATYTRYQLEDGEEILVEVEEPRGGVVRAARGGAEEVVEAQTNFSKALAGMRASIRLMLGELDELKVEEAEVKFGLKATGEAGIFAVAKAGGEVNYEVTLKWKRPGGTA